MRYSLLALFCIIITSVDAQIANQSDEFDKTCDFDKWLNIEDVEGWANTHIEDYQFNETASGKLNIFPYTTAWFASRRSNLLFKEISGDFAFTTEVTATNRAEDDQPGGAYSLAGLMVRTPKIVGTSGPVGTENYVFLSIGSASSNSTPQFEVKNTVNNSSNLQIINIPSTTAQIRLVRVGDSVLALYRLPGQDWALRRRYNRSDMPDTLQVGFVTYSDWNKVNTYSIAFHNEHTLNDDLDPDPTSDAMRVFNPDIKGSFEYGRFTEVVIDSSYNDLDFWDESDVTETEILNIFGYDSEITTKIGWNIWNGSNDDWNDPSNWQTGIVPTSQDSIIIPNCNCPEVVFPAITSNISCRSLQIDEGGILTIPEGVSFTVDLHGNSSEFLNYGLINNSGSLNVINTTGNEMINEGEINCVGEGVCLFEE